MRSKRRFISSHGTENLNTRLFEFQRDKKIIITTYEPDLTLRLASVQPLIGTLYEKKPAQPPSDCYLNNHISSNSFLSKCIQKHFPTYATVAFRKILFVSDFAQAETQCSYGKPQNTHMRTHTHNEIQLRSKFKHTVTWLVTAWPLRRHHRPEVFFRHIRHISLSLQRSPKIGAHFKMFLFQFSHFSKAA